MFSNLYLYNNARKCAWSYKKLKHKLQLHESHINQQGDPRVVLTHHNWRWLWYLGMPFLVPRRTWDNSLCNNNSNLENKLVGNYLFELIFSLIIWINMVWMWVDAHTSIGLKATILISNGNILEAKRFWMSQFCSERTPCRIGATSSKLDAIKHFLVTLRINI